MTTRTIFLLEDQLVNQRRIISDLNGLGFSQIVTARSYHRALSEIEAFHKSGNDFYRMIFDRGVLFEDGEDEIEDDGGFYVIQELLDQHYENTQMPPFAIWTDSPKDNLLRTEYGAQFFAQPHNATYLPKEYKREELEAFLK